MKIRMMLMLSVTKGQTPLIRIHSTSQTTIRLRTVILSRTPIEINRKEQAIPNIIRVNQIIAVLRKKPRSTVTIKMVEDISNRSLRLVATFAAMKATVAMRAWLFRRSIVAIHVENEMLPCTRARIQFVLRNVRQNSQKTSF